MRKVYNFVSQDSLTENKVKQFNQTNPTGMKCVGPDSVKAVSKVQSAAAPAVYPGAQSEGRLANAVLGVKFTK